MLLLVAIPLGLTLGLLCGGSVDALRHVTLKGETLLAVLVPLAAILQIVSAASSVTLVVVRLIVVTAVLIVSAVNGRKQPGLVLVSTGIAANALVFAIEGHMPVLLSGSAVPGDYFHSAGNSMSLLVIVLGDVLPLSLPGYTAFVVSLGDLLMFSGVVAMLVKVVSAREATRMESRY